MSGRPTSVLSTLRLLQLLGRRYPRRSILIVFLLVLAGLSEGIGIATLLPLLEVATGDGTTENAGVTGVVVDVIEAVNLAPSMGLLLAIIVAGIALRSGLTLLAMRESGNASADVATDLRLDLIRALMDARWSYFTRQHLGALANAVSSEATRASGFYSAATLTLSSVFQVSVYGVLALAVAGSITLAAIVFAFALYAALSFLVRMARNAGEETTLRLKTLTARLADGLGAIKPLKAMAREDSLQPLLEEETRGLNAAQRRLVLANYSLPALQEPLIAMFIAVGVYAFLTTFGVSFERLLFIAFLFHRTVTRAGTLQLQYQKLVDPESAFWSIQNAIETARGDREPDTGTVEPTLNHSVQLDGITFSYGEETVLDDLSFTMPVGELTAVVGQSGVGKTTIADLLIGLYQPHRGRVLVDGVPLEQIRRRSWRSMIGYVPQDTVLFHESIFTNVTLGDPALTRADAEFALRAADAWDFVVKLPQGMDTVVGERGARFSGGQRQRIAIARALIRRPALLILDEATTALDPETERAICSTLASLAGDVTVLAISHQPAIVDVAERVIRLVPTTSTPEASGRDEDAADSARVHEE